MLNMSMTVKHLDGRAVPVTVRPVNQVAFERKFSTGFLEVFQDVAAVRFEYICFLAFHASRPGIDFDEWLETVDEIDWNVEPVDPTPPAASAGS
jgi:hypothetical protein